MKEKSHDVTDESSKANKQDEREISKIDKERQWNTNLMIPREIISNLRY